jgi:hypothetical protein
MANIITSQNIDLSSLGFLYTVHSQGNDIPSIGLRKVTFHSANADACNCSHEYSGSKAVLENINSNAPDQHMSVC